MHSLNLQLNSLNRQVFHWQPRSVWSEGKIRSHTVRKCNVVHLPLNCLKLLLTSGWHALNSSPVEIIQSTKFTVRRTSHRPSTPDAPPRSLSSACFLQRLSRVHLSRLVWVRFLLTEDNLDNSEDHWGLKPLHLQSLQCCGPHTPSSQSSHLTKPPLAEWETHKT